jgi:hypothetical protein
MLAQLVVTDIQADRVGWYQYQHQRCRHQAVAGYCVLPIAVATFAEAIIPTRVWEHKRQVGDFFPWSVASRDSGVPGIS